jgi:hypothetical protein
MKKVIRILGLMVFALTLTTGCATIFGGFRQRVRIEGVTEQVSVTVVNSKNQVVYEGEVPSRGIDLRRSDGIGRGAYYRVYIMDPVLGSRSVLVRPRYRTGAAIGNYFAGAMGMMFLLSSGDGASGDEAAMNPLSVLLAPIGLLPDYLTGNQYGLEPRIIRVQELGGIQ